MLEFILYTARRAACTAECGWQDSEPLTARPGRAGNNLLRSEEAQAYNYGLPVSRS
jgi:hypothetical protein